MRKKDVDHLTEIVRMIVDPSQHPTRSDTIAFLMLVREHAPRKGVLCDLGHSVAHDERDQGRSFDYFDKFSLNFRRVVIHGGSIRTKTLSPIREVIIDINGVLGLLGVSERIPRDDATIARKLAVMLAHALNGSSFKLRVATGRLSLWRDYEGMIELRAEIHYHENIVGMIIVSNQYPYTFPWLLDAPFDDKELSLEEQTQLAEDLA